MEGAFERAMKLLGASETDERGDGLRAERSRTQHRLRTLEPKLEHVAVKRRALARSEQLREVPRHVAGNARHFGDAERLAQVIARVLDRSPQPELPLSRRGAFEHVHDCGNSTSINLFEREQSLRTPSSALDGEDKLTHAAGIENVQAAERAHDLIERHLQVHPRRLELKAAMDSHRFDEALEKPIEGCGCVDHGASDLR